jgi:hypothetical protein
VTTALSTSKPPFCLATTRYAPTDCPAL